MVKLLHRGYERSATPGPAPQSRDTIISLQRNSRPMIQHNTAVSETVVNPWIANLLRLLDKRGFDEAKLGAASNYVLEELRKWLQQERDVLAEKQFMADVAEERIQF